MLVKGGPDRETLPPVGSGDNQIVEQHLQCMVTRVTSEPKILLFSKGEYESINNNFWSKDWEDLRKRKDIKTSGKAT